MTVPSYSAWLNASFTIKSDNAHTNKQVKVHLSKDNFDFTKAKADGSDIRFGKGSDAISFFKEDYDNIAEIGLFHIKVPSIDVGINNLNIYYGNMAATDESNGSNTFVYFNELKDSSDLADLDGQFGSASWSVIAQSSSPTGFAVDAGTDSGGDSGRFKTLALPDEYTVQVTTANVSTGGSWQGSLVNMGDSSNYFRAGTNQKSEATSAQIRELKAGVATNHGIGIADGANSAVSQYQKQITKWQDLTVPTFGNSWSANTEIPTMQGMCTSGGKIYITGSHTIGRFTLAGVLEEVITIDEGGTSWGDCEIADGLLYVVRFGSTTSSVIYSFNPLDLAAGATLVADISGDMATGANALIRIGNYWLVGETDATSSNLHFYVYDLLWALKKDIITPRLQDDGAGWQGGTSVNDKVYVCDHSGAIGEFLWNEKALTLDITDRIESTISTAQSLAWDEDNTTFYLGSRFPTTISPMTLAPHATTKLVWAYWEGQDKSMACPYYEVLLSEQNAQAQIGIGLYRQARFTQMMVSKGGEALLANIDTLNINSIFNLSSTGTPDGVYSTDFYNDTTKSLIETKDVTFSGGNASVSLSVPAGTSVWSLTKGSNPPVTGIADVKDTI